MIEKIACKIGRNDEIPNIELAELLCENEDKIGIKEIVEGLKGTDKAIASDCIKVLYEIGERKPYLISEYANVFLAMILSRNNRLVWGSMTALSAIADLVPDVIYKQIDMVLSAFNNGSVITVDNGVTVLSKLCNSSKAYEKHLFPLLLEHLEGCQPKQIAQHAERISICINKDSLVAFINVLDARKTDMSDSQGERINKLKKKLSKQINNMT